MNQNQPPMPASSQRRQGWKDQSYSSRSITTMDRNGAEEPRNRREPRNSSGQIVIDPDENLSDKEIYPPSRVNIPSIGKTTSSFRYHFYNLFLCLFTY